jgi:predicted phosphoribosyltransferase
MARECDRLVTLRAPQRFRAVGQFYEEFPPVSEERVRQLLLEHQPAVEV